MNYDPYYHHRRSIRLKGYDYSTEGYYFVTMCSLDRKKIFADLSVGVGLAPTPQYEFADSSLHQSKNISSLSSSPFLSSILKLTRVGEIIDKQWNRIPETYQNVTLDEYIIMPDHFHGILVIGSVPNGIRSEDKLISRNSPFLSERAPARGASTRKEKPISNEFITLGSILGAFKSLCVTENLKFIKEHGLNEIGKIWQRDYFDHIIRKKRDLDRIRIYINSNPYKWLKDMENHK